MITARFGHAIVAGAVLAIATQAGAATCDDLARSLSNKRSAEKLKAMQMEYELEASALLALRHASAAYQKTRPGLT